MTELGSDRYTKKSNVPPYGVPALPGGQMLFEAVRKAGSVDLKTVDAALEGLSFDSFAGPVKLWTDHQL